MVRSPRSSPDPLVVTMQRNYLGNRRRSGAKALPGAKALIGALALLGAGSLVGDAPWGRAAALFDAQPVDESRFAVLARPVGVEDWTLLVLEQLRPGPLCWQNRPDGLVDPSLNRFDFSGICGRFVDSNGYSLRFGDGAASSEGSAGLRLRLVTVGDELQLQASSPELSGTLLVGRGGRPTRVRDAFVAIRLEPGWELKRRSYGSALLNHVYFSNASTARDLLAQPLPAPGFGRRSPLARRGFPPLPPPPPPPPQLATAPPPGPWQPQPSRRTRYSLRPVSAAPTVADGVPNQRGAADPLAAPTGRVIALQVIPFRE
jgi:hypothetical protein